MKAYFRLLSFAKPIEKFAIPYVIATLFAIIFNTFLFILLGPLMQALFLGKCEDDPSSTSKGFSSWDLIGQFNHYIDGITADDKDLTVESIRVQMGAVNQESFLFNDTIFNNTAFSRPDTTMEEVAAAAKIANAHDFILNTENGCESYVGDRGNKLSGSQKQRICIARAVLANPPIMLLDEATSALDTDPRN